MAILQRIFGYYFQTSWIGKFLTFMWYKTEFGRCLQMKLHQSAQRFATLLLHVCL